METMTMTLKREDIFYKYTHGLGSCLDRAKKHLQLFDDGIIESLFYAALELRMGIEDRLYQYINASIEEDKKSSKKMKEYSVSKLLKILSTIDPKALEPMEIEITFSNSNNGFISRFMPITPEIASIHGKLGAMLHANFFYNNPGWIYKKDIGNITKQRNLMDYRDYLLEVITKLDEINQGTLMAPVHINYVEFIDKLNNDDNP
jgi:hypothetical protein